MNAGDQAAFMTRLTGKRAFRTTHSMKSHIYFSAECQVKSLEESVRRHRKTGQELDIYWKVKDHTDFQYFVFSQQRSIIPILESLLPDNDDQLSPPVKLIGYVTRKMSGTFLTILTISLWDSETEQYIELTAPRHRPGNFDPADEPGQDISEEDVVFHDEHLEKERRNVDTEKANTQDDMIHELISSLIFFFLCFFLSLGQTWGRER